MSLMERLFPKKCMYCELINRDYLLELNIIKKSRRRYVPTTEAIENGIATESSRFGNELVLKISYHCDEEKIMDHYCNNIELVTDQSLPF